MKAPNKDQSDRFKEMAHELGADESGEAFERVFEQIVPPKHRPPEAVKKPKSKKPSH